jgi:hypothetical protein
MSAIVLRRVGMAMLCAAALAACGQSTQLANPYNDGIEHTERPRFNGQDYTVRFRYEGAANAYAVAVSRPGRPMTAAEADRAAAAEVAVSVLNYFACPRGTKADVAPAVTQFAVETWRLQARCG